MSRPLPPEILGLIIDHLHDNQATLRVCCLVSKSWVPWVRGHLFVRIEFCTVDRPFQLWSKAFPEPDNSPAHHTRSLSIRRLHASTLEDSDASRGIRAFHRLETLDIRTMGLYDRHVSFVPFHGLSPALRSLTLSYTLTSLSRVFNLICSFPLLEDLSLTSVSEGDTDGWDTPLTSPIFTGSLHLEVAYGVWSTVRLLCGLPGGLHFSKVAVACHSDGDVKSTAGLVLRCSDTLQSLDICYHYPSALLFLLSLAGVLTLPIHTAASATNFFDLSKTTKLKDLVFRCESTRIGWIHTALQTVKSENLRQIAIHIGSPSLGSLVWDTVNEEWRDFDQLLVQFWTSHSIRPKVVFVANYMGNRLRRMLPELTRRGLVDLVGR